LFFVFLYFIDTLAQLRNELQDKTVQLIERARAMASLQSELDHFRRETSSHKLQNQQLEIRGKEADAIWQQYEKLQQAYNDSTREWEEMRVHLEGSLSSARHEIEDMRAGMMVERMEADAREETLRFEIQVNHSVGSCMRILCTKKFFFVFVFVVVG
jgi:predicted RNase H-like nuclease (RuvC/YqgF family)